MIYTGDPAHDFDMWAAEQEKKLERLPVCDMCGNHIQDEYLYNFGDIVCEDCLRSYINANFREVVKDDV